MEFFVVMTCFLMRGSDIVPKKELQRSLQVGISSMLGALEYPWSRIWLKEYTLDQIGIHAMI